MKGRCTLLLLGSMFIMASCGNLPDIEDADAVAVWMCERSEKLMELSANPMENASEIEAVQEEIAKLEEAIEEHHKENEPAFEDKVTEAYKKNCKVELEL